ncbi:hypothetical protein TrispH2_000670 [Trichoplax sp. H2]|nr:hypothetical protein TrispH2_000670 [Trichoplax sp. H2]|eukprot:RDD47895.1 hypothetical protein TrispH2_000670 [Trichoplax sp. H2]
MASNEDKISTNYRPITKSTSLREDELASSHQNACMVRENIRRLSRELGELKSEIECKKNKLNQVNEEVAKIAVNIRQFPHSMSRSKSLPE